MYSNWYMSCVNADWLLAGSGFHEKLNRLDVSSLTSSVWNIMNIHLVVFEFLHAKGWTDFNKSSAGM